MRAAILLLLVATATAAPLRAQEAPTPPPAGTIRGSVIDAASATPLHGASVTLFPRGGAGLFPPRGSDPQFAATRTTGTGAAGEYRFADLPAGTYSLLIRRVGYEPATVDVELSAGGDARLSVGLDMLPVRLQAVAVQDTRLEVGTGGAHVAGDTTDRLAALAVRQQLFLGADARELTTVDVREAAAVAATDVLHALQSLPGVTLASDRSAMLWVRGLRWDHTRVYYDGLPLLQPLSALGSQAGIGPAAFGAAFLLPGVQPVSLGGEGVARIELRSSPGVADGRVHGSVHLATDGASAAVASRRGDDRAGMQLSVRQGLNSLGLGRDFPDSPGYLPFDYTEVTGRADVAVGRGRLETSGLVSRDRQVEEAEADRARQKSATAAGRITHRMPLGGVQLEHALGVSTYDSEGRRPTFGLLSFQVPTSMPLQTTVDQRMAHGRVSQAASSGPPAWQAGWDATRITTSFRGERQDVVWGDSASADTVGRGALSFGTLWAERRWRAGARLEIETGIRADVGGEGLDALRPAGSVQLRYATSTSRAVTLGVGRRHQYLQQLDSPPLGFGLRPYVVAGAGMPLLVADQVTAGVERLHGAGVLLTANAFARRAAGLVTRDPRPGVVLDPPVFVEGSERAAGMELAARKLTGRVTGLLAYSFQHSRTSAEGLRYATPTSRPHTVDATLMTQLGAWRVGGAAHVTSGAPVTRYTPAASLEDGSGPLSWYPLTVDEPSGATAAALRRFDLFVDWRRQLGRASLTIFGGARVNAHARNADLQAGGDCASGAPSLSSRCWLPAGRRYVDVLSTLGLRIAY